MDHRQSDIVALTETELDNPVPCEPRIGKCAGIPGEQPAERQKDQEPDGTEKAVCDDHLLEWLKRH